MPDEIRAETRRRVIEMYRAGAKTAEITAETGVARSSIYFILQSEGITPSRKARRRVASDSAIDRDLIVQVSDPQIGSQLVDALLKRTLELEREVGRLQALLMIERRAGALLDELDAGDVGTP